MPERVLLWADIIPPKSESIPSLRADMAVFASTAPLVTLSIAAGTSPSEMAAAKYSQAGIPTSVSCIISSA